MSLFSGRDLACQRGERLVFEGVDFTLEAGACLWLSGPNGSGKSSLLRLMAGLLPALSGTLNWAGAAIDPASDAHRARLRYLGHLDAVKPQLTVAENLDFWAAFWAAPQAAVAESLERLGLGRVLDQPARHLSAGQKRRLALARLCLVRSELWLLDEPTTALDESGSAVFQNLVADQRKAGGIVVLSSHETVKIPDSARLDLGETPVEARS
jgi:heme exporter protein A